MSSEVQPNQDDIDKKNAAFWDDLCGSQLAQMLGITDNSPENLKKFDDWYFEFYPYLYTHIPFAEMDGKRVMDVGLGYGTVAQKIAEVGANYRGLDIAEGPVNMANHRIKTNNLKGHAVQGSVLEAPFEDDYFDWVVAIGCLHHTGNLTKAISEVHRVLKPGGEAMIMVYSATSYRQFQSEPIDTIMRMFAKSPVTENTNETSGNEKSRGAYDINTEGAAAPQTEFVTKAELKHMCRTFSKCEIVSENIGEDGVFKRIPRDKALKFGGLLGLDLYCHMTK